MQVKDAGWNSVDIGVVADDLGEGPSAHVVELFSRQAAGPVPVSVEEPISFHQPPELGGQDASKSGSHDAI